MLFFKRRYDGGENSNVTGYWVVEIKKLFSVVLLKFEPGHRENYHSHAFNALTIWLKGKVLEERRDVNKNTEYRAGQIKYTPRENIHKIHCEKTAWALCFRGPWHDYWEEYGLNKIYTLTHGRKIVNVRKI